MLMDFDVKGQQEKDFFTGGSIIMDYRFVFWLEVKTEVLKLKQLMGDLFLTNTQLFASRDISWWTKVVWIIAFFFFKLFRWEKKTLLNLGLPEGEYIFSKFFILVEQFL